jgi:hypothetical protein
MPLIHILYSVSFVTELTKKQRTGLANEDFPGELDKAH